ncbi:MAG: phosphoserine phosphatase SerB [Burkholderiaceae bacterium]|nr:phosphoserine phosphatase SerB [Burkholderiaceae bacterium]
MTTLVLVSRKESDFGFLPSDWPVVQETPQSASVEVDDVDWATLTPLLDHHACDAAAFAVRPQLADFKLVAMDMDATTIENETLDEMAAIAGVGPQVKAVTEKAMRGELDYEASLRARVATMKGFSSSLYTDVIEQRLQVQPQIQTWLTALDMHSIERILISGGFQPVVDHFVEKLGFHAGFANRMTIVDDRFTGDLEGDLVDSQYKARRLMTRATELGIALSQTIAIGDGANDIPMLTAAGIGVGYHPKPAVIAHADIVLRHTGYETLSLFFKP